MTALILVTAAGEARAQDTVGNILSFLLTNRSVVTDDFTRDAAATAATRDAITRALLLEVATLPISSSSGGFTYRFNPDLGVTERASGSFGPIFLERALTAGRGRASFGVSYRVNRFVELDGADLRDGSFVTTGNRFTDERAPFDVETLTLKLETSTATFVGSVGLTDWLELSAALPLVSVRLEGERVNTFRGRLTTQATATSRVTGLADLAVRAKARVAGRGGLGPGAGHRSAPADGAGGRPAGGRQREPEGTGHRVDGRRRHRVAREWRIPRRRYRRTSSTAAPRSPSRRRPA